MSIPPILDLCGSPFQAGRTPDDYFRIFAPLQAGIL
jgi:hypothetical protein